MRRKTKIPFSSKTSTLFIDRKVINAEIPGVDPRFIDVLGKKNNLKKEHFDSALRLRIAEEKASYEEKRIMDRKIREAQKTEYNSLKRELDEVNSFIEAIGC